MKVNNLGYGKNIFLCVDFDGTLVDHRFPDIGPNVPLAFEYLRQFDKIGIKIILFTMRSDGQKYGDVLSFAVSHVEKNGVNLFGVNNNPTQGSWTTSPKAYGHLYVDDAAVGCPLIKPVGFKRYCVDWEIVGKKIIELLNI